MANNTWKDYQTPDKSWKDYQDEFNSQIPKNSNAFSMYNPKKQARLPKAPAPSIPDLSKQKMIDLQNQVFEQPNLPQNKPWYEDAFGKTPYTELFKQGDIAGGTANFLGSGVQGAASILNNTFAEIASPIKQMVENKSLDFGKVVPRQYVQNMDWDDLGREIAGKSLSDYATDVNPALGSAVSFAGNTLSDPTNLLPFGMYDDIAKGLNATVPGSANYAAALAKNTQNNLAKNAVRVPKLPDAIPSANALEPSTIAKPVLNVELPKLPENVPEALKNANTSVVRPVKVTPRLPDYNPNLFAKNTVGAAQAADKPTIDQLIKQYGALPQGEPPRSRDIKVPKATEYGKTSRFVRTALESDAVSDDAAKVIKDEIVNGTFSYTPIKDVDAQAHASKVILDNGLDNAYSQWKAVVNGSKVATKNDIALGETLLKRAADAGDVDSVVNLVAELSVEGTRSGQNIQAMRMLKKMTPAGQLVGVQKYVDKLNKELSTRLGQTKIVLNNDSPAVKELLAAKDKKGVENAMDKIFQEVADQIPASWQDKWNAWRYFAMLGNPKTHIRNFIGNAVFVPARKFKNLIGAGIEKTIPIKTLPIQDRTKAILTPKDKPLIQFSKSDFGEVSDILSGTGKYNPSDKIQEMRTIFKTRWLEKLRKLNMKWLDKADLFFMRLAYTDSFSQAAKARGYTPEFLKSNTKAATEALESIRHYASDEALKATYRDASEFADALNSLSKKLTGSKNPLVKASGMAFEGIIPFKKTPINILKRGALEYSPIGLIRGVSGLTQVKKTKNAAEAIDMLARGLTGSGIMALGAWLASMGLISAGKSDNDKENQFNTLQGEQNYALNIGDYSYTIDWMAPIALPLFVGVELYNAAQQDNMSFSTILDGIQRLISPVFELSMMQGVNDAIKTARYSENPVGDIITNSIIGYAGQAVPTLAGQIARTIDDTRRTTYTDKNSQLPQFTQYPIQRNLAKIPFASQILQPKIDQWGRKDVNTNVAGRIAENFISPGYLEPNKSTPVDKEVDRIYKSTSDAGVLPSYAPKYFTVNGIRKDLTAEEYTEFAEDKGQNAYAYLLDMIKNSDYKNLPDADKADVIKKAYEYSTAKAKESVSDYEPDGWLAKARAAEQKGIDISEYLLYQQYLPSSPTQKETQSTLNKTDFSTSQKAYLWALQNAKWKNNPFK